MSHLKGQIKKDAHKAEKKMDHASDGIADKTKDAAEKVKGKGKAKDFGQKINMKMD